MSPAALFEDAPIETAFTPVSLRPYQARTVEWVHANRGPGARLLVVAPTGAGKTVIASQLIFDELAAGGRVLFCAHRQELITQTYGTLLKRGLPERALGVVMGDGTITHPMTKRRVNAQRPLAPVQVASIDTLRNRPLPQGVTLVIYDECHRSLAPSYQRVASHYEALGATLVGLTATPYRGDGRGLGGSYRKLFVVAQPRELVAEGFLMAPRVFTHPVKPDLSKVRVVAGEYDQAELARVVDRGDLLGNLVDHWLRLAAGVRTVCFAANVAHSRRIVAAFVAAGVTAEHLDGETPDEDRAAILGRLERGETLLVSNVGVLCEGWDQPCVKACILAKPTKSTALYIQCVGRVLRPFDGPQPIVLDHAGCVLEHGLPTADREITLDGRERKKTATVSIKECPGCFAALPSNTAVCPCCGMPFGEEKDRPLGGDPRLVAGNLAEIDAAQAAMMAEAVAIKNLRGRIHAITCQIDADNRDEAGTTNKLLFRRFRKKRSEMSADELRAVLDYLQALPPRAPVPPRLAPSPRAITFFTVPRVA